MKKFLVTLSVAALALAGAAAQQTSFRGFLVDRLCGEAGYPETYEGKIDLTLTPEKNVVACLVMDNCAATGFGMYILGPSGKYVFHAFDRSSSDFVKRQYIDRLRNKNDPAPYVEVSGRVSESGIISGISRAPVNRPAPASGSRSTGSAMTGHNM